MNFIDSTITATMSGGGGGGLCQWSSPVTMTLSASTPGLRTIASQEYHYGYCYIPSGCIPGVDHGTIYLRAALDVYDGVPCGCYQKEFREASAAKGIDPNLVAAIAVRETGMGTDCPSQDPMKYGINSPLYGRHADGHGWGIMGIDDRWHNYDPASKQYLSGDWKRNPVDNINAGITILQQMLAVYSLTGAVHSYNAGDPGLPSTPLNYADIIFENQTRLNSNQFLVCSSS